VLTPKGQYASALQSAVRSQYAGSVQPVPAAAANMAAFRQASICVRSAVSVHECLCGSVLGAAVATQPSRTFHTYIKPLRHERLSHRL
jgi:hypothetical protein